MKHHNLQKKNPNKSRTIIGLLTMAFILIGVWTVFEYWQVQQSKIAMAEGQSVIEGKLSPEQNVRVQENYGKVPLYFIANQGQESDEVDFYLNTKQGAVYFAGDETVAVFNKYVEKTRLPPSALNLVITTFSIPGRLD